MNEIEFTGLKPQALKLRKEIDENIKKVLDHGAFIMGPEVAEFESALRNYSKAEYAISVANGTDALQIALMAFGVGNGDIVFVPSFTYTATAEVILVLGAVPVFVEVDPKTFNIDCNDLEAKIEDQNKKGMRSRAIISVDLFGLPADSKKLNEVATKYGLHLISDAAQSFGGVEADGRAVGTLAPITTTSFFPAKPLGCYGDGGAIFTDSAELATVMKSIRVHGQGTEKYKTVRVGMNSRLDTIQAAILLSKIKVFGDEIAKRNELADRYNETLRNVVITPEKQEAVVSAWAQYTIQVENRDKVKRALNKAGVPTAVYYPLPMHLQDAYKDFGEGVGSLPTSERLSKEVLSLPMNPYFTEYDVETVIAAVKAAVA